MISLREIIEHITHSTWPHYKHLRYQYKAVKSCEEPGRVTLGYILGVVRVLDVVCTEVGGTLWGVGLLKLGRLSTTKFPGIPRLCNAMMY